MDWIDLAQNRERWHSSVNVVINLRFPQNALNFFTTCEPVSFSIRRLLHAVRWLEIVTKCYQDTTWTNGGVWIRLGVWGGWVEEWQTSVPKQKCPNRLRGASRPMSSREQGNFVEGKTDVGKTGRSFKSSAEFRNTWNMLQPAGKLPA